MTHAQNVTILLADDHPMFLRGLSDTIERNTPFTVVAEAGDGEEAYKRIIDTKPQVAILDVEMPRMSGLDVAKRVNDERLPIRVIILTMYEEQALFNRAIDAGVRGYILKESAVSDILAGVSKVVDGEYYFSPALSNYLMKRNARFELSPGSSGNAPLTPMEQKVLAMIGESLSSREIAERLCVTVRTVDTHRYNISRKLGLSGSFALLRYALAKHGNI